MHGILFIQDLAVILLVAGVVGWVCQRIGLSVIVGFLAAGILVGPASPVLPLVRDTADIETLAQVGLVFLMFSIGLRLSLRRLRRLGLPLVGATALGALGMYGASRVFAAAVGFSATEGLFLAGMLMVSSSAIISKILLETGSNHERHGQLATGISILEDVVAVVMLTILNSVVAVGGSGARAGVNIASTLVILAAFVVLVGIAGLLLVPWLLRRMSAAANDEIQTLGLAALLFGLALVAQRAGYSLALGAFLLGIVIAETPHRHQAERIFEGMRDVFTAVFFVAIGLQISVVDLAHSWLLIVSLSAFTLVARPTVVGSALALIGVPSRDALRAGLTAVPIGEFSFVIAQLGVAGLAVWPDFYPVAVGVSLVTTLCAPVLTRRSEALSQAASDRQPAWLRDWLRYYQEWLERIMALQERSSLWAILKKRVIQVSVEVFFVSGLLIFSRELFVAVVARLGRDFGAIPHGVEIAFWVLLCAATLVPLFAIWRNLSAMALLIAQVSTAGNLRAKPLAAAVETGLKAIAAVLLCLWLLSVIPPVEAGRWLLLGGAGVTVLALVAVRRRIIYWHCVLEVELQSVIETADKKMTATTAPWLQPHTDWKLHMIDCSLPDLADAQGKSIHELDLRARFGCSVVGIERQGFMIPLPAADSVLYPRDKVLLLGTAEQVRSARDFLGTVSRTAPADSLFEEVRMEALSVPAWSRAAGQSLGELAPARSHGVQVAGIHRGGIRILNPGASETVRPGDDLLVLATPAQIVGFKAWLTEKVDEAS